MYNDTYKKINNNDFSRSLLVNTKRSGSRFFYLNLKIQNKLYVPSRHSFDSWIQNYYQNKKISNFAKLSKEYFTNDIKLFQIFHRVPLLKNPLLSVENISLLKSIKDIFKFKHIYFPIRESKDKFRSELNRKLAKEVGDWSFIETPNGWKKIFTLDDSTFGVSD
jgi:hypothetical protein